MVFLWLFRVSRKEWKESLRNMLLMLLSGILLQGCGRIIAGIIYLRRKSEVSVSEIAVLTGDYFLVEKLDMVEAVVSLLAVGVAAFAVAVIGLKMMADLGKTDAQAALSEILGEKRVYSKIALWKTGAAVLYGGISIYFSDILWKIILKQEKLQKLSMLGVRNGEGITEVTAVIIQGVTACVTVFIYACRRRKRGLMQRLAAK